VAGKARFEELAMPHMEAAYTLAFWIMRDRAEAEDVVQDAYLRAFRAFAGFKGEAMRPWLLAIVRNTAYRALKVRSRSAVVIPMEEAFHPREAEPTAGDPTVESLLIAEEDRREVRAALASLPLIYRDVVVLREIEGLTYREIAAICEVPIGTVMSRLARGREELRKLLVERRTKGVPNAM
jgi:RNA polymerase sigma-70 factor (ECF subfamily)